MDKLTTLFTTIGDLFNGSSWFGMVQWPFWILLVLIALGGILTARFGKNTLLCQGIQGALKLAIIYMTAVAGYIGAPSCMSDFSLLPLLSASESALTLANPLDLLDRWATALPRVMVRLYFLLFLINAVSIYDYNGRKFVSWVLFQILSCAGAVVIYSAISFFVISVFPGPLALLHNTLAVLLIAAAVLMLAAKLFCMVFRKSGNHTYTVLTKFFTKQKFGSLFTITGLSFLMVTGFLVLANLCGRARFPLAGFNTTAFLVIGVMCGLTLYVFSMFYNERKPS